MTFLNQVIIKTLATTGFTLLLFVWVLIILNIYDLIQLTSEIANTL